MPNSKLFLRALSKQKHLNTIFLLRICAKTKSVAPQVLLLKRGIMVYKKYIKKRGKLYGPYYYKNVRDKSGRVKNIFLGKKPPIKQRFVDRNISTIGAFSITFLIVLILLHYSSPTKKLIQRAPNLNWVSSTLPNETLLLEDVPYFRDVDTTYTGSFSIIYETNALAPFNINPNNAMISFTPLASDVGDYSGNASVILIAKEDTQFGEVITATWQFIIQAVNDRPTMTQLTFLPNASQFSPYYFEISSSDEENNVRKFYDDTSLFDITTDATFKGIINFTPTPSQVGNYLINITLCDNSTIAPNVSCTSQIVSFIVLDNNPPNITRLPALLAKEGIEYFDFMNATDLDGDTINFSATITPLVANSQLFIVEPTTGYINFTPLNDSYVASFNVNFIATDTKNAKTTVTRTFVVQDVNDPPNITSVNPNTTEVIISENTTIIFNFTATDPDADDTILFNRWIFDNYINTSLNKNTLNFTPSFDEANFTSNKSRILILFVFDNNITDIPGVFVGDGVLSPNYKDWNSSSDYHIWNITITNTNRPPIQTTIIPNQTWAQGSINQNLDLDDYFSDPDSDPLFYNFSFITNTTQIMVSIDNQSNVVTLTPETNFVGGALIEFSASDTKYQVTSNQVNLTVYAANVTTPPPPVPQPVPTPVPVSSSTETKIASLSVSVPSLLAAKPDTTILERVTLKNTGEVDLNLISLSTKTSSSQIMATYELPSLKILTPGKSTQVNLIVTTGPVLTEPSYEITLFANSSNPRLSESNILYLASVPTNLTKLEVEIVFAIDLFEKNSECLELKELIDQAKQKQQQGEAQRAEQLIQQAVDSCTSILKQSRVRLPQTQVTKPRLEFYLPVLGAMFALMAVAIAILIVMYKKKK